MASGIPNQTDIATPYIYTSTKSGGVQVFETPAKSTGQQASAPPTESISGAGITVPVRQVLGEYIEPGTYGAINSGPPSEGQTQGDNTIVKVAGQSTSTGNEQNNTPDSSNPFDNNPPWTTKEST
jgi:hypothetical protein